MQKLKILVSAYACEPNKGSEPGVGFNLCRTLSLKDEIHVITRGNNRSVINSFLEKNPSPNLFFHYYDLPDFASKLKKRSKIFLYIYYLTWQVGAFFTAHKLKSKKQFDIVHHLTFGNLWMPTLMVFLGLPFVWGPVGGGEKVPKNLIKNLTLSAILKEVVRNIILITLRLNPLFIYACYKANCIVVKSHETFRCVPNFRKNKCIELIDVGIYPEEVSYKIPSSDGFKILMVGSLEAWRGIEMGIRGFAIATRELNDIQLVIIGSGKDEHRLQRISRDEGISDRVHFTGSLSYQEYRSHLEDCSILLNLTLKEGGVTVFFDALASGKPIINLDTPGSAQVNKTGSGICIKVSSTAQIVIEVSQAIIQLYRNPDLRKSCSDNGCKIVMEQHTWEHKAEIFRQIYANAIMS